MKQIRSGNAVIDAQLSSGYESSSGFHDAFSRIMGSAPLGELGGYAGEISRKQWLIEHEKKHYG